MSDGAHEHHHACRDADREGLEFRTNRASASPESKQAPPAAILRTFMTGLIALQVFVDRPSWASDGQVGARVQG